MTAQVAADLRAAAEVLRRDGWVQGGYRDSAGRHCARGALIFATTEGATSRPVFAGPRWSAASAALRTFLNTEALTVWNDAPGRTADEVIAALEAAADAAEIKAAYDEGRWCGECQYGVVNDPPCCTTGEATP